MPPGSSEKDDDEDWTWSRVRCLSLLTAVERSMPSSKSEYICSSIDRLQSPGSAACSSLRGRSVGRWSGVVSEEGLPRLRRDRFPVWMAVMKSAFWSESESESDGADDRERAGGVGGSRMGGEVGRRGGGERGAARAMVGSGMADLVPVSLQPA